jgi:hypothetical protein
MATTITVALSGDPSNRNPLRDYAQDLAQPYADRLKVEISAGPDETLGSVLDRAVDAFDVDFSSVSYGGTFSPSFVSFYKPDSEGETGEIYWALPTIDDTGRVRWGRPFRDATIAELARATEAGALDGDGTRPYLLLQPAIGNGMLWSWAALLTGLNIVAAAMTLASNVEGTFALKDRIGAAIDRWRRGKEVAEEHHLDWLEHGAQPEDLLRFLGQRPWAAADLGGLIGCSEAEAAAILWAFGYEQAESTLWRKSSDPVARLLADCIDEVRLSFHLDYPRYELLLRERMSRYFAEGVRQPDPYLDEKRFGDRIKADRELEAAAPPVEFEANPESATAMDEMEALATALDTGEIRLEHFRVHCSCGKPECEVMAGFGIASGALKLGFTESTDHFVVSPVVIATVAMYLTDQIDAATNAVDDEQPGGEQLGA